MRVHENVPIQNQTFQGSNFPSEVFLNRALSIPTREAHPNGWRPIRHVDLGADVPREIRKRL